MKPKSKLTKMFLLLLILIMIMLPSALAKQGHMKLLAVRETENGHEGGLADLYLEIKPGTGRVFLETFPLTRTDTQMSTRFAKTIACDMIDKDCDNYDFFYTITADSAIIAGPSAGSSLAILTVAMLEGYELNEKVAATGTINSGGLIGPVGGVKAKVEAAKKAGLKKVLIPAGELIVRIGNETTDLQNLSKQLGIEIIEVSTLEEAVKQFTGKDMSSNIKNIEINEEYLDTMKSLAKNLCDRSAKLKSETSSLRAGTNLTPLREGAQNLSSRGKDAFEKMNFYSSASYCFGSNVDYSTIKILSRNLSKEKYLGEVAKLRKEIGSFSKKMDSYQKKTITDLEAYIVVKERLREANETADEVLGQLNGTNMSDLRVARTLAFANERLNSANSWSSFLGKGGKAFVLNSEVLKKTCQTKISEAEERVQYVELYLPSSLEGVRGETKKAQDELAKGNYELCLSIASKAKADVDIILNVFGVDPSQYQNLLDRKLEIVKNNIARESSKGVFPILGYSYYEYANSLKDSDIFSAMIYSEYALELGNLDIYFEEQDSRLNFSVNTAKLGIFVSGLAVGLIASFLIRRRPKKKQKR